MLPGWNMSHFAQKESRSEKDDNDSFDPRSEARTSQAGNTQYATSPTPKSQCGHNTQRKLR